jgi:type VI secretion system protein ImpH
VAAEGWMENAGVIADALRSNPQAFEFFQAVRLLERLRSERAPVGGFDDPEREVARFSVTPSLAFPAGEIQELELEDESPTRVRVNFMGLTGPLGVLPHPYSMLVLERLRARDSALADFLDLFHHRFISLFYRAWRKYRFAAAHEDGAEDQLREHLLDLIGLGLDGYRDKMPFPDEALIFRAGLLAPQPRGAVALGQLLEDFFQVDVEVEQFMGGWYPLGRTDRCAIGEDDEPGNRLGLGAIAGDEIWDQQTRVRVRVGPLDRAEYDSFLPGGTGHTAIAGLLRFYSHDQFDFELQLVLTADAVPGVVLDGRDDARLGWSTWIRSEPRAKAGDETVLTIQHAVAS